MPLDPITLELSRRVSACRRDDAVAPVLARVERALAQRPGQPQAWEPLDLGTLPFEVPSEIRSCWVFVLRGGASFGAERHPNSHQRTVAVSGEARFEVLLDGSWRPRPVAGPGGEPASAPAISIPPSVWHRITVGPETFLSLSFHTVPAEELVEETPVGDDLSKTARRLYHG